MSSQPVGKRGGGGQKRRSVLRDWRMWLGLVISAVLLYYALRGQSMREVAREITSARPLDLIIGTAFATFVFWLRAYRWRWILEPVRPRTSFRSRFAAVNIGFMGNNLLPLRAGEFARAYSFSKMADVPLVAAFSSLVIERLLDAIFVVGLLFLAINLPAFPELTSGNDVLGWARNTTWLLVVGLLAMGALVVWPNWTAGVLEAVVGKVLPERFRRPIVDGLHAFVSGVSILRYPTYLLRAALWSVAIWMSNALGFYFALRAFDMDLPFAAAIFLQSAVALAVSVPSGPAFVGPYEVACRIVLGDMFGQPETRVLGYALGFHIATFIPVTLMGLYYAWRLGLSVGGLAHAEEVVEEAVEEAEDDTSRDQR